MKKFTLIFGCLLCGLWQSGATAASISYTDYSVFNAAVTGQVTRNFAALDGPYSSPLDVSFSGYTILADAAGDLIVGNPNGLGNPPGGLFTTLVPLRPLTFTFIGTLPTAIA